MCFFINVSQNQIAYHGCARTSSDWQFYFKIPGPDTFWSLSRQKTNQPFSFVVAFGRLVVSYVVFFFGQSAKCSGSCVTDWLDRMSILQKTALEAMR
jgi:hypothetical protein